MTTVIYLDVLLGINLLIAWCLLRATGWLTSSPFCRFRLCVASILASLSTLTLLAPTMSPIMQVLSKLGGAICIVAVAFPHCGPKMLLKRAMWYFFMNVMLAGVVLCVAWSGQTGIMETNNLSVYFNISPQVLVFSILSVWLVIKIAELIFVPPLQGVLVEMQINVQNKKICLQALGDTGCRIQDPLTGQKVVLISLQGTKEILPQQIFCAASDYFVGKIPTPESGIRLISCSTAGGKMVVPAFSAQQLVLKQGKHTAKAETVTVGITKECFQPGGHSALVGADWLEQLA